MAVIGLLGCYVAVSVLFWLPASIFIRRLWGERVDREWILDLLSLVFGLLVSYGTFWLYLLSRHLGLLGSYFLLAGGVAAIVLRRWIDPGPLGRHISAPVRVAFLLGLSYLGGVTLFGGVERVPISYVPDSTIDVPSCYFWLVDRAGDELIPLKFAQAVASGGPLRGGAINFPGDWQFSDRPPLQSAVLLLFWPLTRIIGTGTLGQAAGTMLQVQWVVALAALGTALAWGRRRLSFVLLLIGLSGLAYYNAVYVWPKLLAGALSLAATAPLAAAWRGRRGLSALETMLASSAAALAMLAHGSAVFSLIPVAFLALRHRPFLRVRTLVPAGVLAAVLYAPWSAYQKYVDPPGDRCSRVILAAKTDADGTPLTESLRQAYSEITLRHWLTERARGLLFMISDPELDYNFVRCARGMIDPDYRPAERFGKLYFCTDRDLSYDAKTLAALVRYDQVETVFRALGFLSLAWPVLAWRLVRGPSLRRARLGVLLLGTALGVILWWLLVFQPYILITRSASMAMMIALMAVGALVIYELGPVFRWSVAGLQLFSTALVWVYFVPTDYARRFLVLDSRPHWVALTAALASLAGVLYYCLAARVCYARSDAQSAAVPPGGRFAARDLAAVVAAAIVLLLVAGGAVYRKSPLAELDRTGRVTPLGLPVNIATKEIVSPSALFDGITDRGDNLATWTFREPLVLRFPRPQRLKEIRLHLFDLDGRNYRFQVEGERDGRWSMVLDRSKQGVVGTIAIPIEPAPLGAIRITGLYNSDQERNTANKSMHLKELELIPAP